MSSTQDEYFEVVARRESLKRIFREMEEDIDLVMVGSEDEIAMPVLKKTKMDLEKIEHNLKDCRTTIAHSVDGNSGRVAAYQLLKAMERLSYGGRVESNVNSLLGEGISVWEIYDDNSTRKPGRKAPVLRLAIKKAGGSVKMYNLQTPKHITNRTMQCILVNDATANR